MDKKQKKMSLQKLGKGLVTVYALNDREVVKKVKPLIVFNAESVSGNPAAVIQVTLAPDGAILSTSVLTSSGNSSWDRAVLLALSRAESLPKDDNGKIPQREVKLTFKPKD